ncbi:hypothetical protein M5689_018365 [Euphorbia peplus]|nr:hypothetical protein M5689_018365 [Euphorbia peplus]
MDMVKACTVAIVDPTKVVVIPPIVGMDPLEVVDTPAITDNIVSLFEAGVSKGSDVFIVNVSTSQQIIC